MQWTVNKSIPQNSTIACENTLENSEYKLGNTLFTNIPYYASYLHLLFSNQNSKMNAYVNLNIENVTESSKENQLLNVWILYYPITAFPVTIPIVNTCVFIFQCINLLIIEMTVVDIQT